MESTPKLLARIILDIHDDKERELALLRYIMAQRKISVGDVAKKLGVSGRYIYMILKGERKGLKRIDSIDKAITEITIERGGIGEACCPIIDITSLIAKKLMEEGSIAND